jgi:hypothetical protein
MMGFGGGEKETQREKDGDSVEQKSLVKEEKHN